MKIMKKTIKTSAYMFLLIYHIYLQNFQCIFKKAFSSIKKMRQKKRKVLLVHDNGLILLSRFGQ